MKYEILAKENPTALINQLLSWARAKDLVDIQFDFLDDDQWAILSMHIEEDDTEISLRLHMNDVLELFVGYYDEEDEFVEVVSRLTAEQRQLIPESLKKIMKKVLDDEQGMRLPGSLLAK